MEKKKKRKGKYPDRVQIFTFFSSINLFEVKDFKRNLTDGNLIRKHIKENLMLLFSWLEKFC